MLTRPRIEALVRDPAAITLDAIRTAVAAADGVDAAARTVARLHAGEAVAIEDLGEVLTGAPSIDVVLHLIGAATGDRPAALVALLDRDRFPVVAPGPDLAIGAVFALWRLGGRDHRAPIARHLRRLMLHPMGPLANVLATAVVDELKDPALTAAIERMLCHPEPDWTLAAARSLATPIAELVASLPAENEAARSVPGFTVRSAPRPGRNEPCHCGSGKKYKKCCAEKDDAGAGSPVAGLSWSAYLREGAANLTEEQVRALPLRDLAQVELARLSLAAWDAAVRRFAGFRRWDLVASALDAPIEVKPNVRDDLRAQMISEAISARELDWAREQMTRVSDPDAIMPSDPMRLTLLARPPDLLERLHGEAIKVVASESREDAIELAFALLDTLPALGILVTRDVLGVDRFHDSETLLEMIEDARDQLGLMPGDPAWDRWTAMKAKAAADGEATPASLDAAQLDKEARELRASLEVEAERVAALERQLDRQRAELAAAGSRAARAPESEEAAAERRALRERLETLQAQIREQNEERADLRRKLASTPTARPEPSRRAPATPAEVEPDDADAGESAEAPRRALVPRFSRAGEDALGDVPAHVASAAVRTVGELASGDRGAWRGVKQAQDLEPPLLMARVGIHHRILFRTEGAHLDVLEIVTREALMHALKRLRR